jgi:putative toxin-antitoxin system antitoxin component (TIGR02293 family)
MVNIGSHDQRQLDDIMLTESGSGSEPERLYRQAVELFEGDVAAAREWLNSPAKAFAGRTPLQAAETEVGAREVENLIRRLEYGVFS